MNPLFHLFESAPEAFLFVLGAGILFSSLAAAFCFCAGRLYQAASDQRRRRAANAVLRELTNPKIAR